MARMLNAGLPHDLEPVLQRTISYLTVAVQNSQTTESLAVRPPFGNICRNSRDFKKFRRKVLQYPSERA